VRQNQDLQHAVQDQDLVIHLAALIPEVSHTGQNSEQHPELSQAVNVGGMVNLLQAVHAMPKPAAILFTSTLHVYGRTQHLPPPRSIHCAVNPVELYAQQKVICEQLLRDSGLQWAVFRLAAAIPVRLVFSPAMFQVPLHNRIEFVHTLDVGVALAHLMSALDSVSEIAPDFVRLYERTNELARRVDQFLQPAEAAAVRWIEAAGQIKCVESPLDIADAFSTELNKTPPTTSEGELAKTWIFTSATLGDEPSLNWFTQPIGLSGATIMRVASPFEYQHQALLHIPANFPKPLDPHHSLEVARLAAEGARRLGGRTLVLTTSLKALNVIGEEITQILSDGSPIDVLLQGQWPKRRLMERFRQGSDGGAPGCVLVASASFWEGFDVPGQALQLLIIDKLPFPSPGDPLVKARGDRLQSQGKSSFADYSLPEAIVALKQGAGRLIRHESDRGGLLIADNRLLSASYGRRILAALPSMRQVDQTEDFWDALVGITTASTKVF
jgi:hypothetical protein